MSTPISAPAVIHLHTGYSTADRLRAPTNTPDIEKRRALTLLAAESFTRERLAVDSIAVSSQTGD